MKGNEWKLFVVCDFNNHEVFETLLGYAYIGCLSNGEKNLLNQMIKNMVKPNEILLTIKYQDLANVTTINERQKYHQD